MKTGFVAAVAAFCLAAVAGQANALALAPTSTLSTYKFTGQCSDCMGVGTALLTLKDYMPDTNPDFSQNNVVSFDYRSDLVSYTILGNFLFQANGRLSSTPGPADVSLLGDDTTGLLRYFNSSATTGAWDTGAIVSADFGPSHSWAPAVSSAPEPGTWALMIVGVGLAGAALRRRSVGLRPLQTPAA